MKSAKTLLALLLMATLTGCGSITGFSNAKTDFGCADLSGGPTCRNISTIYEENNPKADETEAKTKPRGFIEAFKQMFFESNRAATQSSEDAVQAEATGYVSGLEMAAIAPAKPWRQPERVFRVWLMPFGSSDVLHDQRYAYVRAHEGAWATNSLEELASSDSAFRPVYPLKEKTVAEEDSKPKQKLPLMLPALGHSQS